MSHWASSVHTATRCSTIVGCATSTLPPCVAERHDMGVSKHQAVLLVERDSHGGDTAATCSLAREQKGCMVRWRRVFEGWRPKAWYWAHSSLHQVCDQTQCRAGGSCGMWRHFGAHVHFHPARSNHWPSLRGRTGTRICHSGPTRVAPLWRPPVSQFLVHDTCWSCCFANPARVS
ncbi:hypothetical protein BCR44DRAFT_1425796 [Catenaria anguillulae PL171]|uniref:Uncharacterized protein n=1 Tax=Catenaria anguillulae PL171 TaxID=765915 RepID=A0A1Y2HNW7_9FUNG|nr:hypothetical protein BCR44DRAFT_1433149 [Catenaria anguillulae PL171]ORZ39876.1 hypothetical protein BCR44DRAFT_1425796 [Catenaria anguillulae PL171]